MAWHTGKKPSIFAHRANGFGSLENSYQAIVHALKSKYIDGIEIDLRVSKDNEFVVMHDATLDRLTNSKGLIRKKDSKELQTIHLKDGQPICFLTDVLPAFNKHSKKTIILEIKDPGHEKELAHCITKHRCKNIIFASWTPSVITNIKKYSTFRTIFFYIPLPHILERFHFTRRVLFRHDTVNVCFNAPLTSNNSGVTFCLDSHLPDLPYDGVGVPGMLITSRLLKACTARNTDILALHDSPHLAARQFAKGVHGVITNTHTPQKSFKNEVFKGFFRKV